MPVRTSRCSACHICWLPVRRRGRGTGRCEACNPLRTTERRSMSASAASTHHISHQGRWMWITHCSTIPEGHHRVDRSRSWQSFFHSTARLAQINSETATPRLRPQCAERRRASPQKVENLQLCRWRFNNRINGSASTSLNLCAHTQFDERTMASCVRVNGHPREGGTERVCRVTSLTMNPTVERFGGHRRGCHGHSARVQSYWHRWCRPAPVFAARSGHGTRCLRG